MIEQRFGFHGYEAVSLEKIGVALELTRERVRQIQNKALKKLYMKGIDSGIMGRARNNFNISRLQEK